MQQGVTEALEGQPALSISGLTLRFGENTAVDDVSFAVAAGEIHGLIGHNGAGKSTVINMLTGQLAPDAGVIELAGEAVRLRSRRAAQRQGIALVDQELSLVPALSIAENLRLGAPRSGSSARMTAQRDRELLERVGLADIELAARVETLNLGQRQLVEIARALGQGPRVMILDEPTATLSESESQFVYSAVRRVAAQGCAVIFVSHRLGEVLALCDRVTVLRDARLVGTRDTATSTVAELMTDMLGEAPHRASRRTTSATETGASLVVDSLAVARHFEPFSLTTAPGTVYALAGQVGSGVSDVLRALAGLHPTATGTVALGGERVRLDDATASTRAGIVFVSNDRKSEGLFLSRSIAVNLLATRLPTVSRWGFIVSRRRRAAAASLAELVSLPPATVGRPVAALSGGNQQKVFIARTLQRPDTRVLLIDEPTRGVDIGGRAAIHELIRRAADQGVTVVFASTELEELVDLADVVITMKDGRVVREHSGEVSGSKLMHDMTQSAEGAA